MVLELNIIEKEPIRSVKVALNMIVKNESKIIKRLLESVLPIIDTYCICDTGSDDNTKEIISNFFNDYDISGCIFDEPFVNFGHNRNVALQNCRLWVDCDYILFLDADMKLEIGEDFNKNSLEEGDYHHILQGNENFIYQNVRIIKNLPNINYCGVTHEYLNIPKQLIKKVYKKDVLFIRDVGDGGCKDNKFTRDIRLLELEVVKNPNCARSHFYLANSYFDIGKFDKAIILYQKRIEIGGWEEEIFYSYYRMGKAYKYLNNMPKAINCFLEAYQTHPGRAEPLHSLILIYRESNKPELASLFYSQAISIPHPPPNGLFVESNIYKYLLHYEFYIFYYYLNSNDQSNYSPDTIHYILIHLLNAKHSGIENILSNYKFYARSLDYQKNDTKNQCIRLTNIADKFVKPSTLIDKDLYTSSTPAISSLNGKLTLNIRYVNYYLDNKWNYKYKESVEKTMNVCVQFSDDTFINPITSKYIENPIFSESDYEIMGKDSIIIEGVQDIRLLEFNNTLYYTGVVLYEKNNKRQGSIHYGIYDISNAKLDGCLIKSPKNRECEKNWVLFHNNKELLCIYEWYPLTIGKIQNNVFDNLQIHEMSSFFKRISGSSNGVIIGDEIWFVCHFISYGKPRHYYHIIVKLDLNSLKFISNSIPFTFEGNPIEYCCGLKLHNDLLYMTYSVKDNNSNIAIIKKDAITFMDKDLMY